MSGKESHPIRNGVIASVVGGIILSFLPSVRSFLWDCLKWVGNGFLYCWNLIVSSCSIPGWFLILLFVFAIPTIILIIRKLQTPGEKGPYDLYKSDFIRGVKWHWDFNGVNINNIWCFCPTCDGTLVCAEHYLESELQGALVGSRTLVTNFICEHCSNQLKATIEGNKDDAIGLVTREVQRRIRTEEWKHSIKKNL